MGVGVICIKLEARGTIQMETAGSFCFFFLFRLNNSALQLSLPADANYCTECTGYSFAIMLLPNSIVFYKNIHIAEL